MLLKYNKVTSFPEQSIQYSTSEWVLDVEKQNNSQEYLWESKDSSHFPIISITIKLFKISISGRQKCIFLYVSSPLKAISKWNEIQPLQFSSRLCTIFKQGRNVAGPYLNNTGSNKGKETFHFTFYSLLNGFSEVQHSSLWNLSLHPLPSWFPAKWKVCGS